MGTYNPTYNYPGTSKYACLKVPVLNIGNRESGCP